MVLDFGRVLVGRLPPMRRRKDPGAGGSQGTKAAAQAARLRETRDGAVDRVTLLLENLVRYFKFKLTRSLRVVQLSLR